MMKIVCFNKVGYVDYSNITIIISMVYYLDLESYLKYFVSINMISVHCRSFIDGQWYSFNDQHVTKVSLCLFFTN